jgi:UPF0755 protein
MLRKFIFLLIVSLVVLGLALTMGWRQLNEYLDRPIAALDQSLDFQVESGSSITRVVYDLANKGLLLQPRVLVYYLRAMNQVSLQAGEYQLPVGITPRQLLDKLARGDVKYYQVTLLEGWTIKQALAHLHQQQALNRRLEAPGLAEFLIRLGADPRYPSPEGLFFPDTYRYVRGMSDENLLTTAYQTMQQTLTTEWPGRADSLPLSDSYEALVLASIVEKETAVDSEREQIAGVFINRLEKGMRLQTDPTVIYALGDAYQGNITRRDLRVDSPYNTYRFAGLPPTPIALPSRRSIEAVLHPAITDNLYFVARGDGSHQFSATLEQHNKAVQEYQVRNRAKKYRSVPTATSPIKAGLGNG